MYRSISSEFSSAISSSLVARYVYTLLADAPTYQNNATFEAIGCKTAGQATNTRTFGATLVHMELVGIVASLDHNLFPTCL